MGGEKLRPTTARRSWRLIEQQHGVISRGQLLSLSYTPKAIEHRLRIGRLHRVWRGVYAVGRRELSEEGQLMAAVLACGGETAISHDSAGYRWQFRRRKPIEIELSVPAHVRRSQRGISIHRSVDLCPESVTTQQGIPITTPARTIIDLASRLSTGPLEAAISEADKLGLVSSDELRAAVDSTGRHPGVAGLRRILDRASFRLADSELERRFLRLVRRAGFPVPDTGRWLNGFKVDFFWPQLGLVVETDGLRYHRNAVQQVRDRRRDQAHTAAGLTTLRFTHAQVVFEPNYVVATLRAVATRLSTVP
jgi:very-short-patch-repair endonuclease